MEFFVLLVLIMQAFAFGLFCSYVAREKGRSSSGWFWLGFLFSFLALVAIAAVPRLAREPAPSAEPDLRLSQNSESATAKQFDGELRTDNPKYQLFLTRKFTILRNDTLGKFTIGDDVFETLDAAIANAHARHMKHAVASPADKHIGILTSLGCRISRLGGNMFDITLPDGKTVYAQSIEELKQTAIKQLQATVKKSDA